MAGVDRAIEQLKALNKRALARDVIDLIDILLELLEPRPTREEVEASPMDLLER